jgi:hypothetical protein
MISPLGKKIGETFEECNYQMGKTIFKVTVNGQTTRADSHLEVLRRTILTPIFQERT